MTNEELQQHKTEIENLLETAREAVRSLEDIKNEATSIRTTIKSRDTETENRKSEIETFKVTSEQLAEQIRTSLSSVETAVNQIQQYQPTFEQLKTTVEDEDTGISAFYNEVEQYRDDAATLKKEADSILIEIKTRLNEVDQIKQKAIDEKDQITNLLKESEQLKESISEHLELITPSTLREEFKGREKRLSRNVRTWLVITIISLLVLIGVVLFIFNKLAAGQFNGWSDWYRVLFIAPALTFTLWAARNYSMERKLLEKYAFKAVVSTSLTSYIKLLEDKFEDNKQDILQFTMGALGKIYNEPYEDQTTKVRGNVSLWNVIKANVELEDEVKEKIVKKVETQIDKSLGKN